MNLLRMKTAYSLADTLYGTEMSETSFEEIALNGWELIGNKYTKLYKFVGDVVNGELQLPCNVDVIHSVTIPAEEFQVTSNKLNDFNLDNAFVENYIEARTLIRDPHYQSGKLIDYTVGDGVLYINKDFKNVSVLYHGILMDEEDNLPLIDENEMRALAAYVTYVTLYKEGLKKRNEAALQLAQTVYQDWLRLCNAARIPSKISDNDMDTILDAKLRWDRKTYGKSYMSHR